MPLVQNSTRQNPPARPRKAKYFRTSVIARALDLTSTGAIARARKAGWPSRRRSNWLEFSPPAVIAAKCQALLPSSPPSGFAGIEFAANSLVELGPAIRRLHVLALVGTQAFFGETGTIALARAARRFHFSTTVIRRWQAAFLSYDFLGLLEDRRGKCGKKTAHPQRDFQI